jgi:hypothetical protein
LLRNTHEAVNKGSKAKTKSTAERHVLKGRERLLNNLDSNSPLAGF